MLLEQLDIHMQKDKVGPPTKPQTIYKINIIWAKDPNVTTKTIQLLK